ncbi:MAG: ISKra4 family transposase [Blastopirellula sp.]|nr:MAG: ISKra4 family transposase [Blastopirellula sp.]
MDVRITVETIFEDGKTRKHALGTWSRPFRKMSGEAIGLMLEDAKTILAQLQKAIVQDQVEKMSQACRPCPGCGRVRRIHDYRSRTLDTMFGRITARAPRIKLCLCQADTNGRIGSPLSPLSYFLPDRATPELQRLQAELASRHSFREAARPMNTFLPCQVQSHVTTRNRFGRVAEKLEPSLSCSKPETSETSQESGPANVFLDGAHIRCRPEYQKRHLDVVVGRIETTTGSRRFGFVESASPSSSRQISEDLAAAGWRPGDQITVFSDGEPALVNYVKRAVDQPVRHILDWWHISMRIRHVENATVGLAQACCGRKDADDLPWLAERIRWLVWHGQLRRALAAIQTLKHTSRRFEDQSRPQIGSSIRKVTARCDALETYLRNNERSAPNYAKRYRVGLPISSSRAEGCVDDIANTRMGKRRRMRWSPRGAHRVALTRAAVLDGRLKVSHRQTAA